MPHYEINVTYRCNASCHWCNRLVGLLDWTGWDVTLDQIDQFCATVRARDMHIGKLKLAGGEPLTHPDLPEIVRRIAAIQPRHIGIVWVLTNSRADTFSLPPGFKWRRSGVLDKPRFHEPPLISPLDLGIRGVWTRPQCGIAKLCGACFEAKGWTFCGLAGTLGRLLDIRVHHDEPTLECDRRVCDHCVWSIGEPARDALHWLVYDGLLAHPTPTYAAALGVEPERRERRDLWPRHRAWLIRRAQRRRKWREDEA